MRKPTEHSGGDCLNNVRRMNNCSEGSETVSSEVRHGLLPFTNKIFPESNYSICHTETKH